MKDELLVMLSKCRIFPNISKMKQVERKDPHTSLKMMDILSYPFPTFLLTSSSHPKNKLDAAVVLSVISPLSLPIPLPSGFDPQLFQPLGLQ